MIRIFALLLLAATVPASAAPKYKFCWGFQNTKDLTGYQGGHGSFYVFTCIDQNYNRHFMNDVDPRDLEASQPPR